MATPHIRNRKYLDDYGGGTLDTMNGKSVSSTIKYHYSGDNIQQTLSWGHPFHTRKSKDHRKTRIIDTRDLGDGFYTIRNKQDHTMAPTVEEDSNPASTGTHYRYKGKLFASVQPTPATLLSRASENQMDAWGATGISRASPTNPLVGMGQFLGELRDVPRIPFKDWHAKAREGLSLSRRGSNEYLNVQFGWVPFLKDVYDCVAIARQQQKRVDQFVNNSGKVIHRRQTIIDSSSTPVVTNLGASYGSPSLPAYLYKNSGSLLKTVTTEHKVWFSGAFIYYVNPGKTPAGLAKRTEQIANHLYGLRASPHLFWQLAPWSWAVDWMTNVGDNIRNLSNFTNDGLVMKYGYVMETITEKTIYSLYGLTFTSGRTYYPQTTITKTCKSRSKATPFGFGLNPSSFSEKQWSIVAALGISKAPRSLSY